MYVEMFTAEQTAAALSTLQARAASTVSPDCFDEVGLRATLKDITDQPYQIVFALMELGELREQILYGCGASLFHFTALETGR